jgi:hypothetical protein
MSAERALRAALWGVAAFAVGYLLPGTLQLPVLVYDPLHRAFSLSRTVSGVSMRYYGDLLVASAAGIAAAALAWKLQPRRTPIGIAAATALSLVALDVLYYLSRLLVSL